MQENHGKRVLLSITAWEPLMMLGAVGLSLIRQLRKQTLTKQSFWRIAFFNCVNNLMDQWQQRQIGCFLIRGKYDLAIKWFCHNSISLRPKIWRLYTKTDIPLLRCYSQVRLTMSMLQGGTPASQVRATWKPFPQFVAILANSHGSFLTLCLFQTLFMSYQSSEVSPRKMMIKLVVQKQSWNLYCRNFTDNLVGRIC